MNILFCNRLKVGTLVGESVHIYEVMSHLSRMGHDVVSLGGDFLRNRAGAETSPEIPRWRRTEIRLLQWPVFRQFRSGLSALRFFWHEVYIFFSTLITLLKRRERIDIIYRRHNLVNSEYLLAKLFRIPSVREVNGIVADETKSAGRAGRVFLWVIGQIERFNMPKADKIIVVTSKLKETLQKDYMVPGGKITVIPNGANTDLFKPMDTAKARRELGLTQTSNYVCFVGNFSPWQGIEYLIRSMPLILKQCPATQFLIVGNGPMKQGLVELAREVSVSDNIIFTGMVPYPAVPSYVNASDICVVPLARERNERIGVSPLKLGEYMACGKPVVASRVPGLEIVEENGFGILVEQDSYPELATAIIKLLKDGELRKRMGKNGRRYVMENQSWESVAKRVAGVCQSLIDGRRKKGKQ
jgi:glycosyltransferase involved in cell wall biosynthesis